MPEFSKTTVQSGQVIVASPLNLPDGTIVTVSDDKEPQTEEAKLQLSDAEFTELSAFLSGQRNWSEWPDFESRLKQAHGTW
jgi:hypothetical protein